MSRFAWGGAHLNSKKANASQLGVEAYPRCFNITHLGRLPQELPGPFADDLRLGLARLGRLWLLAHKADPCTCNWSTNERITIAPTQLQVGGVPP